MTLREEIAHLKHLLAVKEAALAGVCRICGQKAFAPLTLNYGKEYAHTGCLDRQEADRPIIREARS